MGTGCIVPVFVELTTEDGQAEYFVGRSMEAILEDTEQGKEFGGREYTAHQEVTESFIRSLGIDLVDTGIDAIIAERSRSFFLGKQKVK